MLLGRIKPVPWKVFDRKFTLENVYGKSINKRRLEKYLMKGSFSSKNQQTAFNSMVWWFYGVEVHNFEGLSTSL